MFRYGPALLVLWTILLSASAAEAQWFSNFRADVKRGYRRNNAWPEPFIWGDREAVITPFSIQIANGWRRQNLLSDYHFNEENPQLNLAGETKVRYILTQMPPNRRTIFVQRGLTNDVTALRIDMVQRAAGRMVPNGYAVDVVESDLPNDGWPADAVDAIAKRWDATRPDPRLSKETSGPANGGGGSAN
jgi:hypothetical protein